MLLLKSKSLKTELYRKAVHLSSLWIPLLILILPRNWNMVIFFILFVANLLIEYIAFNKMSFVGKLFRKMFIKTLRNKEVGRSQFTPSGSVYVLASALIVSVCFTPKAAAVGMTVMLISDSCAAIFGKLFGSVRFYNGKSLEGTLAFFISAVIVVSATCSVSLPVIYLTALLSTLVEFFERELRIDDNLSITIISGFMLNLTIL